MTGLAAATGGPAPGGAIPAARPVPASQDRQARGAVPGRAVAAGDGGMAGGWC